MVLGVTSGIAAYKSLELLKSLRKKGIHTVVAMTESATKMVSKEEFQEASGSKVYVDLFETGFSYKDILELRKVDHIALADEADVVVIAPATANIIAKIAHGIADDFLTTMLFATRASVIICPSMNVHMWENPLLQENVARIKKLGYQIIDPEEGALACGYQGKGRLAHIRKIEKSIIHTFQAKNRLRGKKIIVTAGATIEKMDDVRFISNKSSGKMGVAIAKECYLQGANVLLLRSETSIGSGFPIAEKLFETTDQLVQLVQTYVPSHDVMFHAAAVSDFQVAKSRKGKVLTNKNLVLTFKPTKKIITNIKKLNPKIKLIAFKAEFGLSEKSVYRIAKNKMIESRADAIVVNDVSRKDRGFLVDTNEVFLLTKDGRRKKIPLASKREIALRLVDFLV